RFSRDWSSDVCSSICNGMQARKARSLRVFQHGRGNGRWGVAGLGWHWYLDVKNRELTITSTHYGYKLRIRLSFRRYRLSLIVAPVTLFTCNETGVARV